MTGGSRTLARVTLSPEHASVAWQRARPLVDVHRAFVSKAPAESWFISISSEVIHLHSKM